jgi:glycosyltransferase involved in cell wall biosynthesis
MGDKNMSIVAGICDELGIVCDTVTGVPHKELPAIYAKHKVFVNASGSERMSLTIGEALCAGCRVLATTENRGNEHYPGLVTFNPTGDLSRAALKGLIRGAIFMPHDEWIWRPNDAARKLTWDSVAKQLEQVYLKVAS